MIRSTWWLPLVGVAVLAGCGGEGQGAVSLSTRVGSRPTGAAAQQLQQGLSLENGIAVDRLRILVRELKLEPVEAEGLESAEIEQGPYLIDLSGDALNGSVVQQLSAEVPAGSYKQIKFKIQKAMGSERDVAELADLASKEASIIVSGTIDGKPFEFTTGIDEEQEYEGTFVIGESGSNVTLNFDLAKWFQNDQGARLDPRDSDNRSKIEDHIKHSMEAYGDDDDDGIDNEHDDDHGSGEVED